MDNRLGVGLIVAVLVAVLVGVLAANALKGSLAARVPVPTVQPSAIPTPPRNHVDIIPNPSNPSLAAFYPQTITVHVGQKVTWTNRESDAHTVTADGDAFDSGVLGPSKSYSWTPKRSGTFGYSCYLHGERGTVVVLP